MTTGVYALYAKSAHKRKITSDVNHFMNTSCINGHGPLFRPISSSEPDSLPSTTTQRAEVRVVKPKYGDFIPPILVQEDGIEEKERIVRRNNDNGGSNSEESDSVIHDITGTTVYVVGVICIIPAAGLVAWIVRYVVKRKGLPNSENGSETGLNCPISDEDMMQVNNQGKSNQADATSSKRKSMCQTMTSNDEDSIDEAFYAAQVCIPYDLA